MPTRPSRFFFLLLLLGLLLGACVVAGDEHQGPGAATGRTEATLDGDDDPPSCENWCEASYIECLGRARDDFDVCICDNNNIGCNRSCGSGGGNEQECPTPEF